MKLKLWSQLIAALILSGNAFPSIAATYTVVVRPGTKYINVQSGETINFMVGGKTFAWTFDAAPMVGAFDLNQVAPAGVLDHVVTAYKSTSLWYIGGR